MSAAADFRGDYSPGGLSGRALRRARARRAGVASGVARRRLSRGRRPPRRRSRMHALSLAYPHRQLSRRSFDRLYEERFPRPEHPPAAAAWERGRATLWEHYAGAWRLYRACGQHTRTTNGQRRLALEARGRDRCRRTVQRLNRRLDALGLALFSHYKDQQATPGHRDCLVMEIRTPQHVTPPAGAGALSSAEGAPALPAREIAPAARAVPPDGGGQRQAPSAPVTERERVESEIQFQQLKLSTGFGPPGLVTAKLVELRWRLAAMEAPASPPAPRPDSGDPHIAL